MADVKIFPNERIDDLHRNNYKIIQNPKEFCFGMDAVLLSGFAKANIGDKVIDLGTGTGVIPILLTAKTNAEIFVGVEIQEDISNMAARSVLLNNLENKITILNDDINNLNNIYKDGHFDVVVSNPPYMNSGTGKQNDYSKKAIARHEIKITLENLIRVSSKLLKFGGKMYMVHRPNRLIDIVNHLRNYNLEPKNIRFVQPYSDKEANMVLIEAQKGAKSFVTIQPTLIVYNKDGSYTEEIKDIYYN